MTRTKALSPLQDAQTLAAARRIEHEQAQAEQDKLHALLAAGYDSVTNDQLRDARDAVEWSSVRLKAAREALTAAELADSKAKAKASPDVARAVVRLLQDHAVTAGLYGIPVQLSEPPSTPKAGPAVYVWQEQATTWDGLTGLGEGKCLLRIIAEPERWNLIPTVRDALRQLARTENVAAIEYGSVPEIAYGPNLRGWTTLVQAKEVRPEIPALSAEPPAWAVNGIAKLIGGAISHQSGLTVWSGVGIGTGTTGNRSAVRCDADMPRHVGTSVGDDGLVRRTYAVPVESYSQELGGDALAANIVAGAESLTGRFISRVGRIESVSVPSIEPIGVRMQGRGGTVLVVTVSKPAE